jgi:hypothetical protein
MFGVPSMYNQKMIEKALSNLIQTARQEERKLILEFDVDIAKQAMEENKIIKWHIHFLRVVKSYLKIKSES